MARFSVSAGAALAAGGNTLQALGEWIAKVGARAAASGPDAVAQGGAFDPTFAAQFQGAVGEPVVFDPSIAAANDQAERAVAALGGDTDAKLYVQVHFDRTITLADGSTARIVNLAVPDFANKLVVDDAGAPVVDENNEPQVDLKKTAEESFGYVALAACE